MRLSIFTIADEERYYMSLRDLLIENEYRSSKDNIAQDFLIPLLNEAISYKRAVGFFSSTSLIELSKGISSLVANNGSIQIVASPYLSDEDILAIKKGYEMRESIVRRAILREIVSPANDFAKERLNLLANLIADGVMDIKIAFVENEDSYGMYHEKMGIVSDIYGNRVAFSGSMNESVTALVHNYETLDVFCSWKRGDEDRVNAKEDAFSSIWKDIEPTVRIVKFPDLNEIFIEKYKTSGVNYELDKFRYDSISTKSTSGQASRNGAILPKNISLYDYQNEAICNWKAAGYRGIFDMATGTGKTFTGLGAIAQLCDDLNDELAVIIVCPFQHLVEQWVEDIEKFNMNPIVGYSASFQKDWKQRLENAIRNQNLHVREKEFFCFVCTNATFSSDFVQGWLENISEDILLVVDEAHNFGSTRLMSLLDAKYTYRLALSATIERYRDEIGTKALYEFFGGKNIEYTLEQAIDENKLTRYKYYPILTTLNGQELEVYTQLTREIARAIVYEQGKPVITERAKFLMIKRARLVAGASDKIIKLEKYIKPFLDQRHILVYCGATTILGENDDFSETDSEDLRQIDVVTNLLGNKLRMYVSQFTSQENIKQREILKREFALGETLQVLVAIKCLDEGVNIPSIKTAFILASTTNPKEYIQRRGRVLRRAQGKEFAEIYDFIALPRPLHEVSSLTDGQFRRELTLVKNEISRAEEFARLAMNMAYASQIIDQVKEAYSINEHLYDYGEDQVWANQS